MTSVSNMSIQLSRRLADEVSAASTDGERFKSAHRLAALDAAHKQMVIHILGGATKRKSAYTLLGSLTNRESRSIAAAGFALGSLTNTAAAGGVVNVECEIGTARVFAVERDSSDLQWAGNRHFQGNDARPVYYILGNTLFLEVNLGSYPVASYIHYVAHPKNIHLTSNSGNNTSTLQTSPTLDEIILSAALAVAQQMGDDFDKAQAASQDVANLIQSIISHEFSKSNKRDKGEA